MVHRHNFLVISIFPTHPLSLMHKIFPVQHWYPVPCMWGIGLAFSPEYGLVYNMIPSCIMITTNVIILSWGSFTRPALSSAFIFMEPSLSRENCLLKEKSKSLMCSLFIFFKKSIRPRLFSYQASPIKITSFPELS